MSRDIIRVGIIGTGVGIRTHLPAFRALKDAEVVALAGSNEQRARFFARKHGIERAMDYLSLCSLPEIDLVCVASPNPCHRVEVAAALDAGKHVLCEKPLAMSVQETRELNEMSLARPDQLALVNHQLRFNPYVRRVKQLIADGAIGRPYYLRLHQQSTGFADRHAPWSWSFDSSQGGGVRLAMAPHLIDLVLYWFGRRIETVCGAMDPVVLERPASDGAMTQVQASSFFSASLELEGGLSVNLSATAASCAVPGFDFCLYGEEGELYFNLVDKLRGAFLKRRGAVEVIPVAAVSASERENRVSIFSGSFTYFAPEIVNSIRTGDWSGLEPAAKFSDAQDVQVALEALARAANTGAMQRLAGQQRSDDVV